MVVPMGAIAFAGAMNTICGDLCRKTSCKTTSKVSSMAARRMSSTAQSYVQSNRSGNGNAYASTIKNKMTINNGIQNNILSRNAFSNSGIGFPMQSRRQFSAAPPKRDATTAAASTNQGGFVQWYEGHLGSRPVMTKAVTGSILWGLGDLVAQVVPTMMDSEDTKDTGNNHNQDASASATTTKKFEYDYPRTARAVFFGFALHAPLSHVHFNFLEWMTVRGGFQGLAAPVFKTVMEQFVYWSWISNTLYHGAMGAMQGKNFQQIQDRVSDVLMDTQYAQWKFWIPIQLLNFKFVPVRHQLNVVLLTSVVWTALLSAWYPPEEDEVKGEEERKQ